MIEKKAAKGIHPAWFSTPAGMVVGTILANAMANKPGWGATALGAGLGGIGGLGAGFSPEIIAYIKELLKDPEKKPGSGSTPTDKTPKTTAKRTPQSMALTRLNRNIASNPNLRKSLKGLGPSERQAMIDNYVNRTTNKIKGAAPKKRTALDYFSGVYNEDIAEPIADYWYEPVQRLRSNITKGQDILADAAYSGYTKAGDLISNVNRLADEGQEFYADKLYKGLENILGR